MWLCRGWLGCARTTRCKGARGGHDSGLLPLPSLAYLVSPYFQSAVIGGRYEAQIMRHSSVMKYDAYWSGFREFLQERGVEAPHRIPNLQNPSNPHVCIRTVLRRGVQLNNVVLLFRGQRIRVEIHVDPEVNDIFDLLKNEREKIESKIGGELEWEASGDGARIAVYGTNFNPNDGNRRPAQYEWFLDMTRRFEQVFRNRIPPESP